MLDTGGARWYAFGEKLAEAELNCLVGRGVEATVLDSMIIGIADDALVLAGVALRSVVRGR